MIDPAAAEHPGEAKDNMGRKRGAVILLAIIIALVAALSASCSVIGDMLSSGLEEIIGELEKTAEPDAANTETDLLVIVTPSAAPYSAATAAPTSAPTKLPTAVPTSAPTSALTATAAAGSIDDFVPGYGGSIVRINKTDPGEPLRYWRATLKDPAQVAAYNSLEAAAKNRGNVAVITQKISFEDFKPVFEKFMLDHPEIFWYDNSYHGTGFTNNLNTVEIAQKYGENQIKLMQNGIDDVTRQILSKIPDGASDFEAELIIFEWLAANVQYDLNAPNAHTLYGALVDRRCVCEGYAEAFQYLCGKVGIPATSVTGIGDNGKTAEKHKWNAAKIGGRWYLVEPTWANTSTTKRFLFLNCSDFIAADHTPKDYQVPDLPSFSATAADYLNYYGLAVRNAADTGEFDEVFMRAVTHFIKRFPTGSASAAVLMRAPDNASAQRFAGWITDSDSSRVKELMRRVNDGEDRTYVIWGDAELLEGNVVAFKLARY